MVCIMCHNGKWTWMYIQHKVEVNQQQVHSWHAFMVLCCSHVSKWSYDRVTISLVQLMWLHIIDVPHTLCHYKAWTQWSTLLRFFSEYVCFNLLEVRRVSHTLDLDTDQGSLKDFLLPEDRKETRHTKIAKATMLSLWGRVGMINDNILHSLCVTVMRPTLGSYPEQCPHVASPML